jgi:hypothetical protein
VKSSSSRVAKIRETCLPPHRARLNMTMRNPNASASFPITAQMFVSPESTTDTIAR